jgi:hypothetical protein
MRLRHNNLLNMAHFLQTESEPHLVRAEMSKRYDLNMADVDTVLQTVGD